MMTEFDRILHGLRTSLRAPTTDGLSVLLYLMATEPFDNSRCFRNFSRQLVQRGAIGASALLMLQKPVAKIGGEASDIILDVGKMPASVKSVDLLQFAERLPSPHPRLLPDSSPLRLPADGKQYLMCVPIERPALDETVHLGNRKISVVQQKSTVAYLFFWLKDPKSIKKYRSKIHWYAVLVAHLREKEQLAKCKAIINNARIIPREDIKDAIDLCITGIKKLLKCDSVTLLLNRGYTEVFEPNADSAVNKTNNRFEIVKDVKRQENPIKSVGFWVNDDEGLLSEVINLGRNGLRIGNRDGLSDARYIGLTFHLKPGNENNHYYCQETGKSLRSFEFHRPTAPEQTIFYAPLFTLSRHGAQIGALRIGYSSPATMQNTEKKILAAFIEYMSARIRNSFIYSLNIDHVISLRKIKSLFEIADKTKLDDLDKLEKMLPAVIKDLAEISKFENVAIGYIKGVGNGKEICYPCPRGWSPPAVRKYSRIAVNDPDSGLAGLAIRLKRDVFLSYMGNQKETYLGSTIFVNEERNEFLDERRSGIVQKGFKNLTAYYRSTVEANEKVFATFVFLIQYKNIVLGSIRVEVTKANWNRYLGLAYVNFFKAFANTLALFFYKVRLAQEEKRIAGIIANARQKLASLSGGSRDGRGRVLIYVLTEILAVDGVKINICEPDNLKLSFRAFKKNRGNIALGLINADIPTIGKLLKRSGPSNVYNICLSLLLEEVQQNDSFFLYIPSFKGNLSDFKSRMSSDDYSRFINNNKFASYLGIVIGEPNEELKILQMIANTENAFDELLIDYGLFRNWVQEVHQVILEAISMPKSVSNSFLASQPDEVVRLIPFNEINPEFGLVGSGSKIERLKNFMVAGCGWNKDNVLIVGEDGTGHHHIAEALHKNSHRSSYEIIWVDCSRLRPDTAAVELFGQADSKGEISGESMIGKFLQAHKGTIVLQRIENLHKDIRGMLLNALTNKKIQPVGALNPIAVDCRIIATSDTHLGPGNFDTNLFFRLSQIKIVTVPLREMIKERPDNLLELISYLLYKRNGQRQLIGIDNQSYHHLLEYQFPGNVRELQTILNNSLIQYPHLDVIKITGEDLPSASQKQETAPIELNEKKVWDNSRKTGIHSRRAVKILFLCADPKIAVRRRMDDEVKRIGDALQKTQHGRMFTLQQEWAVEASELQKHLMEHRPYIVHFSGYGTPNNELMLRIPNSRKGQAVSADALSRMFALLKDNIRCVFLNACYSKTQAKSISEHIDCVIGMSEAIGNKTAIKFAEAFYQAIGFAKDIDTAFQLGCNNVQLHNLGEEDRPKLLAPNCDPKTVVFVNAVDQGEK